MYASQLREQVDVARLVEEFGHQPMKQCGQTGPALPSSSTAILVACQRRQRLQYMIASASESTVALLQALVEMVRLVVQIPTKAAPTDEFHRKSCPARNPQISEGELPYVVQHS